MNLDAGAYVYLIVSLRDPSLFGLHGAQRWIAFAYVEPDSVTSAAMFVKTKGEAAVRRR